MGCVGIDLHPENDAPVSNKHNTCTSKNFFLVLRGCKPIYAPPQRQPEISFLEHLLLLKKW